MTQGIQLISNDNRTPLKIEHGYLNLQTAQRVQRYHQSFPQYCPTPLADLKNLANTLGLGRICVKDESYRFGLNAFKVLGGSYAMGQVIARRLGLQEGDVDYEQMVSASTKARLGDMTFVTATDGNHGRGVAWTAAALGQRSVVYMPKGSSTERLQHIADTGSEASITDMSYDDAVRHAQHMAEKHGWILLQDTAWEGYEEIPTWIMQGYMTMAYEAYQQLKALGESKPTHIFLQAGVGSMAAAVQGFFANIFPNDPPVTVIVEPDQADCLFRTASAADGNLHCVTTDMNTIMAGLACGEPSTIGWKVLDAYAHAFVSCPDWVSAKGMRMLGHPISSDPRVISGESGAVGLGLLAELMTRPELGPMRDALHLDDKSVILCFSTEGDTDRRNYLSIVWDGAHPSF